MKPTNSYCSSTEAIPELVRFYRSGQSSGNLKYEEFHLSDLKQCPFCFQDLHVGNCYIRLKPKMKLTASLRKLCKKAEKNWKRLSKKEQHLVNLFTNSKNYITATCLTCNKKIKIPGYSRSDLENKWNRQPSVSQSNITKEKSIMKKEKMNKLIVDNTGSQEHKNSIKDYTVKVSGKSKTTQLSSILKQQSKKKKQKVLHKSLQHILTQEKQRSSSSSSLADFLSNMK